MSRVRCVGGSFIVDAVSGQLWSGRERLGYVGIGI